MSGRPIKRTLREHMPVQSKLQAVLCVVGATPIHSATTIG